MPGIICRVCAPADTRGDSHWRRGLALASQHPEHVQEQYGEPGFQLACIYHPDVCQGPRILVTDSHVLAYYGNVHEDAWALWADDSELCRVLLDRFHARGLDALKNLNGRYDIVIWNRRDRVLQMVSDRFGANRHYWLHQPGTLHLACEVKVLAVALDDVQVEATALASMLTFGYHIGDLTLVKGVKSLPNACQLEYRAFDDRLRMDRYWDYPYGEAEPLRGSKDELAASLHGHLTTAVRRQLRRVNKILLPISGGMDSRTLAGLLAQTGFTGEVIAYSYGQPGSNDVRYGRALARRLGYPHVAIAPPADFVTRHLEEAAWRFDAEWSAKNAWIRFAHRQPGLLDTGGGTLLHGLMGDIVLGSDLFGHRRKAGDSPLAIEALRQAFLDCQVSYMPVSELGSVFSADLSAEVTAGLNALIDRTLEPLLGLPPFFALTRAEFVHRQRRRTAWLVRCVEEDIPAITPFLDRDVVDFSTQVPYELFHDKQLYKHMIRQHLPAIAAIPLSDSGQPLAASRLRAGAAWRIERLLKRFPALRRRLARRREMLDFRTGLQTQADFFLARMNVLEELSPPLPTGAAAHRMEALLAGTAHPALQACALLPPAVFMQRMRAAAFGPTAS